MNERVNSGANIKAILLKYSPLLILLLLIIVSSILSPVFFSIKNIFNVLRQQAPYTLIAMGVLMTILTGGIDLSPGAVLAVSNVMLALFATDFKFSTPSGIFLCILAALLCGAIFGAVNGFLVAKVRMAPFISTLALMTIARGLAYQLTGGSPIKLPPDKLGTGGFIEFGQIGDPVIGLPLAVWVVIVVVLAFWFIMRFTTFGRLIIATGSNETAVRLAGINVKRYQFSAYLISGLMAGAAGVLIVARSGIAAPSAGDGFELQAIAACVIGGASLSGGKGRVGFTIIGVLIMALIGNIMNLLNVPAYPQQMLQGVIIILAVLLNSLDSKKE